jgi:threonine/homoserine/homoserine lactone efflux protein
LLGLSLGLSAGIAPGPLLALVLTTTLRAGFWSGARVALSPVVTDGPIIVLTILVVSALPAAAQDALTVAGGLFVIYLGIEAMRGARNVVMSETVASSARQDLLRGAMVNALSPHPWLFWISVGAPIVTNAWDNAPPRALAFLAGFYALLIGSKIALAAIAAAGRKRLCPRAYQRLSLLSGALLLAIGLLLTASALR